MKSASYKNFFKFIVKQSVFCLDSGAMVQCELF